MTSPPAPPFLVDENLPPSTAPALQERGFKATWVADIGLKGAPDQTIYNTAKKLGWTIITSDLDFANTARFEPLPDSGIIVLRPPRHARLKDLVALAVRAAMELAEIDLRSSIAIVDTTTVRLRRSLAAR